MELLIQHWDVEKANDRDDLLILAGVYFGPVPRKEFNQAYCLTSTRVGKKLIRIV